MPATFSTASSRPKCSSAACTAASTSDSLVTSQCTGSTASPRAAAVSFSAPLMSAATTRAPRSTNSRVDALAMPEPAPVIRATLPSSSVIGRGSRDRDRPFRAVGGRLTGLVLELGRDLGHHDHGVALVVELEHLRADPPAAGVALAAI